ncbi:hypothetical protein JNUCC21_11195 [Bacillus sp. JNUCC-21]|uniref:hypothetical protein n=1 Tax=Bacillus sp. JNUCC-21 TaxID=3240102 RepID=UPI0035193DD8
MLKEVKTLVFDPDIVKRSTPVKVRQRFPNGNWSEPELGFVHNNKGESFSFTTYDGRSKTNKAVKAKDVFKGIVEVEIGSWE